MKTAKFIFHIGVTCFALILLFAAGAQISAQPQPSIDRLEYQVETLQGQFADVPTRLQNLDRRLTIIETILHDVEGGSLWNQLSMGGIGLLLLKEVAQAMKRKQERG